MARPVRTTRIRQRASLHIVLPIIGVAVFGFAGLAAGLIAWAARSDFVFRGCSDIPKDAWEMTANCNDGWIGQWAFGAVSVVCLGLTGLIAVRGLKA